MEKQKNHERLISRYLHAKAEWDKRLGQADTQVKNWRLACIASLIIVLLLLVGIIISL